MAAQKFNYEHNYNEFNNIVNSIMVLFYSEDRLILCCILRMSCRVFRHHAYGLLQYSGRKGADTAEDVQLDQSQSWYACHLCDIVSFNL